MGTVEEHSLGTPVAAAAREEASQSRTQTNIPPVLNL